jgi:hypothetical protein
MPYATDRDRTPDELEISRTPWPAPPLNFMITQGVRPGQYDLVWTDPSQLAINGRFILCGVNIYRSFDSEYGPFERITHVPLGSTFWRDITDNVLVPDEDVTDKFILDANAGAAGNYTPRYVFRVEKFPIVKEASQGVLAHSPEDVIVMVDGVRVPVVSIFPRTGEVEIGVGRTTNIATQKLNPSVAPQPGSRVTCTYRYTRSLLRTDLGQRVFYRAVTVGLPIDCDLAAVQPQDLLETPLENASATSNYEIEKLDYMWKEAVRRNHWILQEGGERVLVFLKKHVGIPCPCIPDDYHKQARNDCPLCYGTGVMGGYEGPYDGIIAPDDAERRIAQKDIGRTVEHTYEVWTGPSPLLSHRDFIVKLNGDRYSIGPVRMPTNRGMILQQHFSIGIFDEKDIRYKVPLDNPVKYAAVQFAPSGPERAAEHNPTNKPNIPQERQYEGKTPTWENIEYGILLLLFPLQELLHEVSRLL